MTTEQIVTAVMEHPNLKPKVQVLMECRPEDTPALLAAYKSLKTPHERSGLVISMAYAGGQEAVDALKHSLFDEFAGQDFTQPGKRTSDDENALTYLVRALGILASDNDDAYDVVVQGTHPDYWRSHCKWTSDSLELTIGCLTSDSILAVGLSGRPEARDVLARLWNACPGSPSGPAVSRNCDSAITSARFYLDLIEDEGMGAFRRHFVSGIDNMLVLFSRWKTNQVGLGQPSPGR